MSIQSTDAFGPFLDTGVGTQPSPRPSIDVETHGANEVDSGTKVPSGFTVATFHPRGTPHRSGSSPR